jgi:hypothetical protein
MLAEQQVAGRCTHTSRVMPGEVHAGHALTEQQTRSLGSSTLVGAAITQWVW